MVSMHREREVVRLHIKGETPERQTPQCTVLVVEDDPRTLSLEQFILEAEGFAVEGSRSGEEALEFLRSARPSLVLLDVGLPDINGFEVCRQLREFSAVPVIMVTGLDTEESEVQGLEAGADGYITKPFSANILVARTRATLRRAGFTNLPEPQVPVHEMVTVGDLAQTAGVTQAAPARSLASDARRPQTVSGPSAAPRPASAPPAAPALPRAAPQTAEPLYEGNARLLVEAKGSIDQVAQFMDELRQNPQLRLLRMVSNQRKGGVDVSLALRQPVPLAALLRQMAGVTAAAAEPGPNDEPLFRVSLGG